MSGSAERGEQHPRQVEDEKTGGAEAWEAFGCGLPPAQTKTPRRCVQTKLNFFTPPKGRGRGRCGGGKEGEEEPSSSEDEGRRKPKRKKKAQPRTPTKVSALGKEGIGFNSRSNKLLPASDDGSDFFVKVSEKRLKQKHQREQEAVVDLTVEDDMCSKSLQVIAAQENDFYDMGEQSKDYMLCGVLKGPETKLRLRSGKSNAAEDTVALDLNRCQPTMDTSPESKNTEGNVHASAPRSVHPFFSHWKTTKPISEFSHTGKLSKNDCSALDNDVLLSCRPIHVFETLQDNAMPLNWGHWKISERSSLELSNSIDAAECNFLSVSDVLVTPLKFDGTVVFRNPSGDVIPDGKLHVFHIPGAKNQFEGTKGTSASLTDMQEPDNQHDSHINMLQDPKENTLSCRCTPTLDNLENEQQYPLYQESSLYQLHRDCWTDCSLWTNKHQPDKAAEVCGNTESVRFLTEWLKSWQERQSLTVKNSTSNEYVSDDSDDSLYQNDSDSENEHVARLENVLLITGPVGCGKSAAIYACAKEQGFQIIEVNASDERNGTHIKQKFGEAVDSHAIELCSIEDAVQLRRKQDLLSMMGSSVSTLRREFENGDLKEVSKATRNEIPPDAVENQSSTCRVANKNLFLFEDVDAVVDEDRGFINTMMQLAETSRRPIILTTNSKNPILPQALSRLVVDFTRPSTAELLAHMLRVCAAEGAQTSPWLVEHLIRTCQGDIRKTLLLLQFWCQGQRGQQDEKIQCTYSPLLFDLDAAHQVVTKITPWAIPCELALKVEEEIAKAISTASNQVILHQLKEEDDTVEPAFALRVSKVRATGSPAMGKNPCPIFQHGEFLSPSKDHGFFSDDSSSPLTFTRRRLKHKTDTVLSSESEDVLAADSSMHLGSPIANSIPPGACDLQSSHPIDYLNCLIPFDETFGEHVNLSRDHFMTAEIASTSHVCDSYMSRCMHEISLVPETEISNRQGHRSTTSSHFSASFHDFLINDVGSMQVLSQEEINNVNGTILATHNDPYKEGANIHEIYTESVHGNEEVGPSEKEAGVDLSRGYLLMDECSRAGFGVEFVPLDGYKNHAVGGSVEETWRKLRSCHDDLKSHVTPGQGDAIKILDLTSGLADLISELDILLKSCLSLTNDILEPSAFSFDEPCSSSWCDEHLVIASTLAQHGLCFYASKAAIKQSNLGYEIPVFLSHEMLVASTSSMAFGKLLSQKKTIIDNLHTERGFQLESSKSEIPIGRELESTLCDVVHPIIPARMHMVLKGPAFHEYVSFLSCMSKSENLRLSENKDQFRQQRRRARTSHHYLRSTPFALSPEDVELLAGCSCFGQVGLR